MSEMSNRLHAVRGLVVQVLYLAPLFWFNELLQNCFFLAVEGHWGWYYPGSPHHWFAFKSLGAWAAVVVMFSLADGRLRKAGLTLPLRILLVGTAGWLGELALGFCFAELLHQPLQIWIGGRLQYVRFAALPFWWTNVLLFDLLTRHLPDIARAGGGSPARRGGRGVRVAIPGLALPGKSAERLPPEDQRLRLPR